MSSPPPVMTGCEPVSHRAGAQTGVVVLHGFTGNPSSMRGVADAMIAAGFDVEMPRLPGHGTKMDDMLVTGWADWYEETERVIAELGSRVDRYVLLGQSAGATLALASALHHPEVSGLVGINPATRPRDEETMALIEGLLDDGVSVVPGTGSDIADPESSDIAYDGTPLLPLKSLLMDGITPITDRFSELTMPLRLITSRQDHVVDPCDSEHLAATWGGVVEHTWLERSFHVATLDYERDQVVSESVAFVERITA